MQQQLETLGVAFINLEADPAEQLGIPRPIVLPTTLVVDPDGQLAKTLVGPQTMESLALATNQATSGTPE